MEKRYVSQIDKRLLKLFGLHKSSECVMIGDNIELDINSAKKCGINTIWVNSKKIENNNIQTISVNNINEINQNLIESLEIDIESQYNEE